MPLYNTTLGRDLDTLALASILVFLRDARKLYLWVTGNVQTRLDSNESSLDRCGMYGPFDVFCAICGGPFMTQNAAVLSSSANSITEEHLEWLKSLRLIGKNLGNGKAYLSGSGTMDQFGSATVDIGEDDNVPVSRNGTVRGGGQTMNVSCYLDWSSMGGGAEPSPFPVHCRCWELLLKVYDHRRTQKLGKARNVPESDEMDLDILRSVMEGLLQGCTTHLKGMDYYELQLETSAAFDDIDSAVQARSPYLCDPVAGQRGLLQHMPVLSKSLSMRVMASREKMGIRNHDQFNHLPAEIIAQFVDELPAHSLHPVMQASWSISEFCNDDVFWIRRIQRDMPFIDDCSTLQPGYRGAEVLIDWAALHRRLLDASYAKLDVAKGTHPAITGLASRRRIWNCAEQLLRLYNGRVAVLET